MSKYLIWIVLVLGCYGYAQYRGYYVGSFFTGNHWKRTGSTFNHK